MFYTSCKVWIPD